MSQTRKQCFFLQTQIFQENPINILRATEFAYTPR
jgi:hypothetical protein